MFYNSVINVIQCDQCDQSLVVYILLENNCVELVICSADDFMVM